MDNTTKVELIIIGVWMCPICQVFNTETEIAEHVTCTGCGKIYEVEE